MTTILGLDPSTVSSGWAILAVDDHDEAVTASGVYRPTKLPSPRELVLCSSYDLMLRGAYYWLRGVMDVHPIDEVAIETPFYKLNARTLVALAQVGAVFRLVATLAGLPVVEVAPAQRCTALGLAGNTSKQQLLAVVNAFYHLTLTDHNEADAVAIAAAAALEYRQAAHFGSFNTD